MYVPLWLIGVVAVAFLVLLRLVFRGGGEMIERQRRPAPMPTAGQAALLARPDVAAALAAGHRIEAIKLVRAASGLGLKEAKELVERA